MSNSLTRRGVLRTGAVAGAGLAVPTIFTGSSARAYTNEPTGSSVTLGFNVPQTGPYADEGADELRAFELAVEHLNGGGDGDRACGANPHHRCTTAALRTWDAIAPK